MKQLHLYAQSRTGISALMGGYDGHDGTHTTHFKAPLLSMTFLNAVMISCMSFNE